MSNTPEEFEKLQKLLKLKRYEQPPPGYFNNFSTNVINRLEREARRAEDGEGSVIKKFFKLLETNAVAAGLFGVSLCGLLVSGITWSQIQPLATASNVTVDVADSGALAKSPEWLQTASANVDSLAPNVMLVSSNSATLFDGISLPRAELTSFH